MLTKFDLHFLFLGQASPDKETFIDVLPVAVPRRLSMLSSTVKPRKLKDGRPPNPGRTDAIDLP